MSLAYTIRLGMRSLGRRKLQSSLSVLGIVMGVAAVITMLSIGGGARREALAQIRALGTDLLVVRAPEASEPSMGRGLFSRRPGAVVKPQIASGLTLELARRLERRLPGLGDWAPASGRSTDLQGDIGRQAGALAVGTSPEILLVRRLAVARGRFLVSEDRESGGSRVCVLGAALAPELFPGGDPLGRMVRLEGRWFTVVGVMAPAPYSGGQVSIFRIRELDRAFFVPLEALPGAGPGPDGTRLDEIGVRLASGLDAAAAARAVREALDVALARDGSPAPAASPLVSYPEELLRQADATVRIFNMVMGSIAGISLLVGGIGIMNVMLLSVSERRREIGIRRAMGARRAQIAEHFLAETLLLTTAGGVLGVFFGSLAARSVSYFAGWATLISPAVVAAALAVSAVVGLVFGLYPAWKAADMDPVDAIRMTAN